MTPEESASAQREALEKMQAQGGAGNAPPSARQPSQRGTPARPQSGSHASHAGTPPGKSKKGLIIGIVAAVVVIAIGIIAFIALSGGDEPA